MRPGEQISIENLDILIERHMAFIIRTISSLTGRYVAVENDEEFSIALSAFAEAVEKYDEKRGSFLGLSLIHIYYIVKPFAICATESYFLTASCINLMESMALLTLFFTISGTKGLTI